MCLLPENEQFAEMDDMADWGSSHVKQSPAKVIPIRPVETAAHELAPHFEPEPLAHITWREALWIAGAPLVALAIVLGLAWLQR